MTLDKNAACEELPDFLVTDAEYATPANFHNFLITIKSG
jgi:hypothetical protein